MRTFIVLLLSLHALLHLLGFLKSWGLLALPALSGRTLIPLTSELTRALGLAWLFAALVLLVSAGLRAFRNDAWWLVATGGIVLSQALIILQWQDAKAGTVANVLIACAIGLAVADARFRGRVDEQVRLLLSHTELVSPVVAPEELAALPSPVRRWLDASGIVGMRRAQSVRLTQRGRLRTSPKAAFMTARAEQYFNVEEPGFVWHVDTKLKQIPVSGADVYAHGHGRMEITLASLFHIVDAVGSKIDQGSALRFLGEIVWFPSAALSSHIRWQAIDENRARATLQYQGVECTAVFSFDVQGRFLGLHALRYLGDGELTSWSVKATAWSRLRGIEVPTHGSVAWNLPSGDFDYYQWEILDVEQNPVDPFEAHGRKAA
jgi:hypothetical protein